MQQTLIDKKLKTLDVKNILEPILRNYDEHVLQFANILKRISCTLVYEGPVDIRRHVLEKTGYACSISCSMGKKPKILKSIFPIMIRSKLDLWIRKKKIYRFDGDLLLYPPPDDETLDPVDIIPGFFIIGGYAKQLPYFFTNDPTNTHVLKNSIVRCYCYDVDDRGKELSLYVDGVDEQHSRGDLVVTLNDGTKTSDVEGFFDHCRYPTRQAPYMHQVFDQGRFDIDHLGNKMVVSPGHMFVKLFMKYVYIPLRDGKWDVAKAKASMVVKSIESGELLHVLSRKTLYHKEASSAAKMVGSSHENRREIGMNGEVYVEKITGCYREITLQTYPLNPYLAHLIVRQMSSKVKNNSTIPFHPSHLNFLCIFGTFETKNIGRTNIMTRNTYISTSYDMDSVFRKVPGEILYTMLDLRPDRLSDYYVVVNEACIPVTRQCFHQIDLARLKERFVYIECYADGRFIYVRFKVGIFFKKMGDVWVSPRDEKYWAGRLYGLRGDLAMLKEKYKYEGGLELAETYALKMELADKLGYEHITGHHVDLNPYFAHNSFSKVIWAFNALKNAVLATDRSYSLYFMETLSAYTQISPLHEVVCEPVDDFSKRFVIRLPRVTVAYMSFLGKNQEDSIVAREDLRAFDCYRIVTIRLKLKVSRTGATVFFRPVAGDAGDEFLGTVVCPESSVEAIPQSCVHVNIVQRSPHEMDLFYTKPGFKVLEHHVTTEGLIAVLEQYHRSSTGDKMCSLYGQKGIISLSKEMPLFDEKVVPDLIVNPYCLFRMTPGQILEGLFLGEGRDAQVVRNSKGVLVAGARAFYGRTIYFPIAFFSSENFYASVKCVCDRILHQAVRGRSRHGGMRIGNMELMNCLRGNGIASCFEEKFIADGDGMLTDAGIWIPKSASLCVEDAKFFKCDIQTETEPCVVEVPENPILESTNKKRGEPDDRKRKSAEETAVTNKKRRVID